MSGTGTSRDTSTPPQSETQSRPCGKVQANKAKIPVSALVLTRNEKANISACLSTLGDFDQVIVVDSQSDDGTRAIVQDHGTQIVDFHWNGKYPKKKQWAIENVSTRNDWIFLVDADERPDPTLIAELRSLFAEDRLETVGALDIPVRYHWRGIQLRHGHRVVKRSITHKHRAVYPEADDLGIAAAWEVEGHYQPVTDFAVKRLHGWLNHDDNDSLSDWVDRHNRYSDWEAELRAGTDLTVRSSRISHRIFQALPAKSLFFFLYAYIIRGGFIDGRPGFEYALSLSYYHSLIDMKRRQLSGGS